MKITTCAFILVLLSSCAQEKSKPELSLNVMFASNTISEPAFKIITGIEGYYVGLFEASKYNEEKNVMYSNKITIAIDSLNATACFGHSIVAGNIRPFSGSYTHTNDVYTVNAKEPGDDKYDGVFMFELNASENKMKGIWAANNKTLAVYEREYALEKREFIYNPDNLLPEYLGQFGLYGTWSDTSDVEESLTQDVFKFNPSKQLLKGSDIENMYQADLEVLRNSMYARHGYSFKNRIMRVLFDNEVEWYMPISIDVTSQLTAIEKQNEALL